MEILTEETVRLRIRAGDKMEAVKQAGELLVRAGYVARSYVDGMLAREEVMSTYLGNGIAIPHGRLEDLNLVRRTGVSVLQLPEGVEWEPGEKAHLVIGLAARSDEHVGLLANLVEVLQDPVAVNQLVQTPDPMMIIRRLTRKRSESAWN